ncbi:nucleotide exchange factor GrpE [Rubrolithibacter danxiaensis]|uniref:nucleotide exchange factor GrpE n=1 Tax=Rubrolithibacter danxiaensis TaxID=3390805 RepID=UPI003BF7F930
MNISDMLKKKIQNQEEELQNAENPQSGQEQEIMNEQNNTADDAQNAEVEKLRAEVVELNNKYVRLYAEFDNFKRRTSKERVELLQTAGKDVLVSLLPVIDDFERALKAMEVATEVAPVKAGVELVHNKLKNILSQQGLKEMESKGAPFDPDLQEAISNIPAPSEDLKGKVIDEVEKGYYLNDKVIRFAKVVVGA